MTAGVSDVSKLLSRPSRSFDLSHARANINGRTALVTGGGGSIGSALALALCRLGAGKIVPLDSSEHALANLLVSVDRKDLGRYAEIICDVRDRDRIDAVLRRTAPNVIFHAAALKHVPLGDRHPTECILTNLVGVKNMLEAADVHGTQLFVFISSDKAAAPTSVMGACKRLAELYIEGRSSQSRGARTITVRFGNVIGSQGSVVKVFERQIARGGPITLTHSDMRRYFMTIDEAVGLILLAAFREARTSSASSFILDMGAPIKILHLAERMVAASGRQIKVIETGVREGEKLEEELYDQFERLTHTEIEGLLAVKSHARRTPTGAEIDALEEIARSGDEKRAHAAVFELLHECLCDFSSAGSSEGALAASSEISPHASAYGGA